MLICLQRRGISTQAGPVSLGRRLLLESVQIPKCQRSEISLSPGGSSDSLRAGGCGETCQGSCRHSTARLEGQPGHQLPSPGPAQPSKEASCSRGPHTSSSHTGSPVSETAKEQKMPGRNGQGAPHTTHSHSGGAASPPLCPESLRLKAMVSRRPGPPQSLLPCGLHQGQSVGLAYQLGVSVR